MKSISTRPALMRNVLSAVAALGVAIAGVAMSGSTAQASTLPGVTDDYSGTYGLTNAYPSHGIWLPSFKSGASTEWGVVNGSATYDSTAGTLNLSGRVQNNSNAALQLDFNWSLNEVVHAGPPACGGGACTGATAAMKANMVYFDFAGQQLTGTAGTALAGLSIDLTIKPSDGSKPPQLGYGGNWRTLDFGYSNWFKWSVSSAEKSAYGLKNTYGDGDMNLTLTPTPVPVPAAAWMLIAGVGALGAMRRRRKAA